MLGDQVPENRKRGLERVIEQEEAFSNGVKLAMVTRRDIRSVFATSGYRVSSTDIFIITHLDQGSFIDLRSLFHRRSLFSPYLISQQKYRLYVSFSSIK